MGPESSPSRALSLQSVHLIKKPKILKSVLLTCYQSLPDTVRDNSVESWRGEQNGRGEASAQVKSGAASAPEPSL